MNMKKARFFLPFQHHKTAATAAQRGKGQQLMSTTVLPPELIEAIIDEVGTLNDRDTLKTCAVVSLSFVFQSQKYLFRTVNLDRPYTSRKKTAQRFHHLVVTRPHLGIHVRQLQLGDDADDDMFSDSWITSSESRSLLLIPQILEHLPRLEALSLTFNANAVSWKEIPAATRAALGRVFRKPSVKEVSLAFITAFPPQLLIPLARLQSVSLSCVEIDQVVPLADDVAYVRPAKQEINLQTLFLRGTSPATIMAISQILGASPPPTLQSLAITPTFEHGFCNAVTELIAHSGKNITNFEWLPSIHFSSLSHPIDLNALPRLRILRFRVSFRKPHASGPFSEVLRLLQQLSTRPSSSPFQSSTVEMVVLDCHCVRPIDSVKREAELRPLDKVLAKPTFGALREIKIRLSTKTSTDMDRHRFTLAFQHLLPMLQSKGVLISVTTLDEISFLTGDALSFEET